MTPHEFLRLTPRSNCGACGHPACLAFAVAVTRGGADPTSCPYLDCAALPMELTGQGQGEGLIRVDRGQQERDMALVQHLKSKIQDLDFAFLAGRLGAGWIPAQPDTLVFPYLNRPVALAKNALRMAGETLVDPRDQILLYNYVAFGGGNAPQGLWIGMESLPNSISKVTTLKTYCENRLARRFSGRSQALERVFQAVGALAAPDGQSASAAAVIPVLPYVPLLVLFWDEEPGDGFDARVKILFDARVLDFLDLESLVFAAERLAERLAELDEA